MTTRPSIVVPGTGEIRFDMVDAALLCALSQFKRIWTGKQEQALLWLAQRYLCAWLTPKRFFARIRTDFQPQAILMRRVSLLGHDCLDKVTVEGGCEYWATVHGLDVAAKIHAAMPAAVSAEAFADARAQHAHERRINRGVFAR